MVAGVAALRSKGAGPPPVGADAGAGAGAGAPAAVSSPSEPNNWPMLSESITLQPPRPTSIALEEANKMIRFATFMGQNPITNRRPRAGHTVGNAQILRTGLEIRLATALYVSIMSIAPVFASKKLRIADGIEAEINRTPAS